jgi:hypothetical protein
LVLGSSDQTGVNNLYFRWLNQSCIKAVQSTPMATALRKHLVGGHFESQKTANHRSRRRVSFTRGVLLAKGGPMRRIVIATLFGLVAGGICVTLTSSAHLLKITAVTLVWILLNRTVMGFAIGTSALKLHWAWNGIVMGLVVGSIFSYFMFMNLGVKMLLLSPIGNAIFGLMIEFFTTVVFKQPAFARERAVQQAAA